MDNKNFQIEGTKIQLPVDAENIQDYLKTRENRNHTK